MTMGGTAAGGALFDTDDSELSQLLSQARQDLARRAGEQAQKNVPGSRAALAVPLRLDAGDSTGEGHLIRLHHETGMAQLNTSKVHNTQEARSSSVAAAAAVNAELEGTAARPDPTVRRMRRGELARAKEQTAGKRWFGMKAPTMTPELRNDLRVLQLRNVLDPKRFYKKSTTQKVLPKYFESGTIIEGPTEFYSSRLSKKERRVNLVDEVLADKKSRDYLKRKIGEIHAHNASGGKNWYRGNARGKDKGKGAASGAARPGKKFKQQGK
ncbi:rrna-processing protein fcf2 [Coemansia biformis]|uniref:Rrna-processing protein fcf2 n=1 Tax=Coemansia biformis TaxID=1286918 RepID=A0A9W7YHG6_9FUNG|nr:rrna-processing protein fcf2 [Coemansia biformis]